MRPLSFAALAALVFAAPARADTYALVDTGRNCTVSTIAYDGSSAYTPPGGLAVMLQTAAPAACPAPPLTVIPTYAFILRFTPAQAATIRASADPIIQQFMLAVTVAQTVTLTDPLVVDGVGYLVTQNILTSDQAANILSPAFTAPE